MENPQGNLEAAGLVNSFLNDRVRPDLRVLTLHPTQAYEEKYRQRIEATVNDGVCRLLVNLGDLRQFNSESAAE